MNLQGQVLSGDDTINIGEVIVRGTTGISSSAAENKTLLDSSVVSAYKHRTVADLITENSMVYIKSYGPGGISTPSFRGTSAGHTTITWNGLNINNPMPGQFDLSLVPAGLIDNVDIYCGGNSMEIASGGLGGIIDLVTKPEWEKRGHLSFGTLAGSYGRYSGLVKLKTGANRFRSSTKAFFQKSENNFRYRNTANGSAPEWERREDSQVFQKGLMQEIFLKTKTGGTLSGRFWYQSAERNLPVPIISQAFFPPEKQHDESLRTILDFENLINKTNVKITTALFYDKLRYLNEHSGIDSRNKSNNFILKTEINRNIGHFTRLKAYIKDELNIINSNNYSESRQRNLANAVIMSETTINDRLITGILLSESLLNGKLLAPDFSASADLQILHDKDYLLKFIISKNSKIPALNDMYWSPGGNPALENENAWAFEIGWDMTEVISSSLKIKDELTFYRNFIDNLIQWHPGSGTFWVADNLKKTETTGFESGVTLIYHSGELNALLKAGYTYTKAVSTDSENENRQEQGKQIIYVPASKLNTLLRVSVDHFYSGFNTSFVGKRFLTADNSQYLPAFMICNLDFGMKLDAGKTSWDMSFTVDNLLNQNYQNVAWYPMPGRSYTISLLILLSI